jgi:HEPN domain-containing protein
MDEHIRGWIAKARGSFATATRECAVVVKPNYDAVCFHSEQCVERLMKALLLADGIQPPKAGGLEPLRGVLRPRHGDLGVPEADLVWLSRAGVVFRYPGETANQEMAAAALAICTRLREQLLALLHPSDD